MSGQMPILKHKDGEFFFICKFEDRIHASEAGFSWHPVLKVWFTKGVQNALKLIQFADSEARNVLNNFQTALTQSSATESALDVPCPEGLEFLPYQKAGVEWCLKRKTSIIGDQPGLGKTMQFIGLMNYWRTNSSLVICPASLKYNWEKELRKWMTEAPDIDVVVGTKHRISPYARTVIVNYDLLSHKTIASQLLARRFDCATADEFHYLKNGEAKRTKSVLDKTNGVIRTADKKVLLSGTPILNRPIELHAPLSSLSPETIHPHISYFDYGRKFCAAHEGPFGWDFKGSSNLPELNTRLRSTVMIRRMKKDVLSQLPDKTLSIVPLAQDKETKKILAQEKNVNIDELKRKALNLDGGELAKERHEMALAKIPACLDHITTLLQGGLEKVVVFAYHRDVIAALHKGLAEYRPVVTHGGCSAVQKNQAVEDFQNKPEIQVFIAQVDTAVGYTITAASHGVFVEFPWVPAILEQALDRMHRIGQKNAVLGQLLVVRGSLEENMLVTIFDKQSKITKAVDVTQVQNNYKKLDLGLGLLDT
jgi:SWI/SNF-related matrix-associated actin-dependent regulator 1 of chromatin subfamily A